MNLTLARVSAVFFNLETARRQRMLQQLKFKDLEEKLKAGVCKKEIY